MNLADKLYRANIAGIALTSLETIFVLLYGTLFFLLEWFTGAPGYVLDGCLDNAVLCGQPAFGPTALKLVQMHMVIGILLALWYAFKFLLAAWTGTMYWPSGFFRTGTNRIRGFGVRIIGLFLGAANVLLAIGLVMFFL